MKQSGVTTYLGQKIFKTKTRPIGKNDFWWRLGLAFDVFRGEADVIIWPKWADNLPGIKHEPTLTKFEMGGDAKHDFKILKNNVSRQRKSQ